MRVSAMDCCKPTMAGIEGGTGEGERRVNGSERKGRVERCVVDDAVRGISQRAERAGDDCHRRGHPPRTRFRWRDSAGKRLSRIGRYSVRGGCGSTYLTFNRTCSLKFMCTVKVTKRRGVSYGLVTLVTLPARWGARRWANECHPRAHVEMRTRCRLYLARG